MSQPGTDTQHKHVCSARAVWFRLESRGAQAGTAPLCAGGQQAAPAQTPHSPCLAQCLQEYTLPFSARLTVSGFLNVDEMTGFALVNVLGCRAYELKSSPVWGHLLYCSLQTGLTETCWKQLSPQ